MRPRLDLLVERARIWSDGGLRPAADAIGVADGRILMVGRGDALASLADRDTARIDAGGRTVTAGATDAHLHLLEWSRSLDELDLYGAVSEDDVARRVAGALPRVREGEPLVGRGWDANDWTAAPSRASLDRIAPRRVVVLYSRDAHNAWVNGAALAAAGIGRDARDPEGGAIERDAQGMPTGLLREHAMRLVRGLLARSEASDLERVRRAARRLHALGITAVHDFEGAEAHRVLRGLARSGGPWVRVLAHLPASGLDHALALGLGSGTGDARFRIGGVKLFADGTLGSRTAALLAPYDGTDERGMELIPETSLRATVARAWAGGIAVAIHAIGDRATRVSLDAFEAAAEHRRVPALPSRIEHAQLVDAGDLGRFQALGIAASVQPTHCLSDLDLVRRHWSTRTRDAYPWRRFLDGGALLAFGSDAPIEPPSVAAGLRAAVTRSRPGEAPFEPSERLSLDQALAAYVEAPARLAGTWPETGRLAPGAHADLVVWDRDLHAAHPEDLAGAYPLWTVLEGAVVHAHAAAGVGHAAGTVLEAT